MNLNKVILAGNLTRSPELRYSPNGNAIAPFGIATNRTWTDERGERHEEVDFHRVTVFGRQAETAAEFLTKGQLAMVEGRLQYDKWVQDGVARTGVKIIAERVQGGLAISALETVAVYGAALAQANQIFTAWHLPLH